MISSSKNDKLSSWKLTEWWDKNISGQVDALFDALVWFKYNLNTFLYFQCNGGQIFLYLFIVIHLVSVQGVRPIGNLSQGLAIW